MGVKEFFDFMKERHAIYERRQSGLPFPWTDDPILQKYKFCNVFRELDTGTIWCREHIEEPYAKHSELFFNIAAYRSINCLESWTEVYNAYVESTGTPFIREYYPEVVRNALRHRRERGERIFTNAHMLTGVGGIDKIDMYVDKTWSALWHSRRELEPTSDDNLESAFHNLLSAGVPAIGRFLAYEIITDLRHTRYLEHANDIYTWANPGNGARRGVMRVFFGKLKDIKLSDDYCLERMKFLLDISREYLNPAFPVLEMRDIEHTLCEFDKYERTRLGEGIPRLHYVPPK
jgi:hypothetical protein